MKFRFLQQKFKFPDKTLLGLMLLLLVFGIIMVYDSSVVYSQNNFGGKYHFLLLQSGWVTVGVCCMLVMMLLDYHLLYRFALPLYLFSLILLLMVFVPGIGAELNGARRWISMGAFTFQPSEMAKFALIVYLSAWLSSDSRRKKQLLGNHQHLLFLFVALISVLLGLVLAEPNFSIAVILAVIGLIMYFASGAPKSHFILLLLLSLIGGSIFLISSPYRLVRLTTYLNPEAADPLGEGYHISQVKIALGSGGILGRGLGQSRQKYDYLPEVYSDSIFAIVGEELGFVGASLLVLAFIIFLWRGFMVAGKAPDEFGRLLALGITSWFMLQVFVNLSAMIGLIPLTGVTIPFISCGGSATLVTLTAVGVLLNISRQTVSK